MSNTQANDASRLPSGAYQEPKRLPFGCVEQRKFEQRAEHVRQVDENGVHVVFGNGANEVMRVVKPHRRDRTGGVWFLNAETGDGFGGEFRYSDYFPNAHVHPIFADILNGFAFSSDSGASR